ncbi:MAG: hypothetical protein LBI28_05625 [Treponema sp.]|nr:hypothetical protein [Treponema sp.]
MKKILFTGALLVITLFSVNAQGFYFDIGLGVGGGLTQLDGTDVTKTFAGVNFTEIGVELGLKAGYGPIANMPIYIAGVVGGIGHRLDDGSDYLQFNSYLLGLGVIFYPIPLIQIAGSIGFSGVGNQTSLPLNMYKSTSGIAGDISVAVDLGSGNHGCLIGLKYFSAVNTLEISGAEQNQSIFGIFFRYTFRHKLRM